MRPCLRLRWSSVNTVLGKKRNKLKWWEKLQTIVEKKPIYYWLWPYRRTAGGWQLEWEQSLIISIARMLWLNMSHHLCKATSETSKLLMRMRRYRKSNRKIAMRHELLYSATVVRPQGQEPDNSCLRRNSPSRCDSVLKSYTRGIHCHRSRSPRHVDGRKWRHLNRKSLISDSSLMTRRQFPTTLCADPQAMLFWDDIFTNHLLPSLRWVDLWL